jgi:peptidyl-tRNA hydrolase, PTH2 family
MKQIIVMRTETEPKMRKGKMVAQGAHASMGAVLHGTRWGYFGIFFDRRLRKWFKGRFTKVCVGIGGGDNELMGVYHRAKDAGLICFLVTDAGLTEFGGVPTVTCCAIGPAEDEDLKPITGHLKLL